MWRDVHVGGTRRKQEMASEKVISDLSRCMDDLPTKSMEKSVRPLVQQVIALIRHRSSASSPAFLTSPIKAVSTDQTIHVVSKAITTFVQAGKTAASENQDLNEALNAACHDAVKAGESFCRILTQQPSTSSSGSHLSSISPSTSGSGSQNGVDSGVDEDLDEELLNLSTSSESDRKDIHSRLPGTFKSATTLTRLQGHPIKIERSKTTLADSFSDDDMRKTQLLTSCWDMVTSVIQILLLADKAVIADVMHSNDMVLEGLTKLENCHNFHEFMREFTEFGRRMINLAHYTGARQKDLKSDIARVYISGARFVLEKGTAVLLTSSKMYFRHPSSNLARTFRDNCFSSMRSALERMAESLENCHVPKSLSSSGSFENELASLTLIEKSKKANNINYLSAFSILDNLKITISNCQKSTALPGYYDVSGSLRQPTPYGVRIERLSKQFMQRVLEFTNSPFCGHEQRSDILRRDLALRKSLGPFLKQKLCLSDMKMHSTNVNEAIDNIKLSIYNAAVARLSSVSAELSSSRSGIYGRGFCIDELIAQLTELSKCLSLNISDDTTKAVGTLMEFSKQIQEACKLAQQCFVDPTHVVSIKHVCEFIEGLTQQLVRSVSLAQSLNGSSVAIENFTALIGQWRSVASSEISSMQTNLSSVMGNMNVSNSALPSPDTPTRAGLSFQRLDTSEQTVAARLGLEIKLLSSQCFVECQHWRDVNDVPAAMIDNFEAVSNSSKHIYLFTRGEPPLKTTVDFFNAAIEVSNAATKCGQCAQSCLDKFRSDGAYLRSDVLSACSQLPSTCQRLSATVKTNAHGKSAVFSKVMTTLRDVRATLELVSKLSVLLHSISIKRGIATSVKDVGKQTKQRSKSLTPSNRKSGGYFVSECGRSNAVTRKTSFGRYSGNNNNNNNNIEYCADSCEVSNTLECTVNDSATEGHNNNDTNSKEITTGISVHDGEIESRGSANLRSRPEKRAKKLNACGIPFRAPSLKHISIKSTK